MLKLREHISLLEYIQPYTRLKEKQVIIALQILRKEIKSKQNLEEGAQLADTLSSLNVRSNGRRKNFLAMIQTSVSSND